MKKTKTVPAPFSSCVRETNHYILHVAELREEDWTYTYAMLRCAGCHAISMGCQELYIADGRVSNTYYPSPISRQKPKWATFLRFLGTADEKQLFELLDEIYQAIAGGQHRLAAMGIRALLEQVMIAKVGDLNTFDEKLDAFQAGGYVSL